MTTPFSPRRPARMPGTCACFDPRAAAPFNGAGRIDRLRRAAVTGRTPRKTGKNIYNNLFPRGKPPLLATLSPTLGAADAGGTGIVKAEEAERARQTLERISEYAGRRRTDGIGAYVDGWTVNAFYATAAGACGSAFFFQISRRHRMSHRSPFFGEARQSPCRLFRRLREASRGGRSH